MSSKNSEIKVLPEQYFGNLDTNEIYWLLFTAQRADHIGDADTESAAVVLSVGTRNKDLVHKYSWKIPRENYLGTALYNEAIKLSAEILEIEGTLSVIEASQIPEDTYFEDSTGGVYKKEAKDMVYQRP